MYKRLCNFCGKDFEVQFKRLLRIKKISIIYFKDHRFQLEFKNNTDEFDICENCAGKRTIKDLWEDIQNKDKVHDNLEDDTKGNK
jgi:hypothetical protein